MEQDGRTYSVNKSTIALIPGDITASRAEAIVSSDDGDISRGGGVSLAIEQAAHGPMHGELRKHVPAKVGDVVVTSAANLPAKYILHAITLPSWSDRFWRSDPPSGAVVRATVQRIMELLPLLRCHSVAFPVIGAGVAGVSYEDAAKEMCEVLVRSLLDSEQQIHVELYLHDRFQQHEPEELATLFDAHLQNSLGIEIALRQGQVSLVVPTAEGKSDVGQRPSEEQRRREIYDMLLHLARRRDRLEADLLAALLDQGNATATTVQSIRTSMKDVARLREIYLHELNPEVYPNLQVRPKTVFVSSTYTDLVDHREAVRGVISRMGLNYVGMEGFVPAAAAPGDYIRRKVEESEIYLGILGMRYGSIDPSSGFSMTELEYRQAVASNKPRLMFVMDQTASISLDKVEMNPEGFAKLITFRDHVLQRNVCGMFRDVADLTMRVERALREYASTAPHANR